MAVSAQGLMNAIVIEERDGVNAYDVCMRLKDNGLLVSPDANITQAHYGLYGCVLLLFWIKLSSRF